MLTYQEKKIILEKYLLLEANSYIDGIKDELYVHFFVNENDCNFLDFLSNKKEIICKIDFVISKVVLHEHEDAREQIIENYIGV